MSAAEKASRARRVMFALSARRINATVMRRAERLYHKLACDAFVAKHMASKATGGAA
jgi:hypothetical protein